jgi:hypothetical protein
MPAGLTILYPPSPQTTDEPAEEDDSSDEERSLIDLEYAYPPFSLNGYILIVAVS